MNTVGAATEDLPPALTEAIDAALDAWSEFVKTGDLDVLGSSFVLDGPQWQQFKAESAAWEEPPAGEPLLLKGRESRLRDLDSTMATIWVEVEASRVGFVPEVFEWDFDLIHQNGRWLVWTVVVADESPTSALAPINPTSTPAAAPTTAPTTSLAVSDASSVDSDMAVTDADTPPLGTRLPALSAWVVVITVVGVAVAGYMAPRIDRSREN